MAVGISDSGRATGDAFALRDAQSNALLDDVAAIAACALRCPIVVVSLLDTDRFWLRSDADDGAVARRIGQCGTAVKADDMWRVRNVETDPRTLADPVKAGRAGLRFYVGVPLRGRDGQTLGTLAALDEEPRAIGEDELSILKKLATIVVDMLDLRLELRLAQRGVRAHNGRVT